MRSSNSVKKVEKDLTILVVDDTLVARKHIVSLIKLMGLKTLEAGNGKEGYEIALGEHPDLILMDIMMPGVDGLMSIRMLKADKKTCDIRIIVLTSIGDSDTWKKCIQMGADGYMRKPISDNELYQYLKTFSLI